MKKVTLVAELVGRRITGIKLNRSYDKTRKQWITNPVLTLDNGKSLRFNVQETDENDTGYTYGVELWLSE